MSALAAAPAVTLSPPACAHGAALTAVLRRLAVSLTVACGVPAVILWVTIQTAGVVPAVLAALAWSYGALAWRRLTGRPTSGLLLLTVTILTVRTLFTLTTGSTYFYFLQPVVSDGVVAVLFLLSLLSARPLVARLAADFYPLGPDLAAHPRVQRLFWRLTLMWGVVGALKSSLGYWLLQSLSVSDFVLVKSSAMLAITAVAVVVTIRTALLVLKRIAA